jgi:hypothetical protein
MIIDARNMEKNNFLYFFFINEFNCLHVDPRVFISLDSLLGSR